MKRSLPLHVAIPLSLATLACLVTFIGAVQMRAISNRQLEEAVSGRAISLSRVMVPILRKTALDGDRASAEVAILNMSSMPFLAPVLVFDEDGRVLFTSDPALRGLRLSDTYADEARSLIARARASGAMQAEIDPDRRAVRVAQPYRLSAGPDSTETGRTAVLFTQTDLRVRKHQELMSIVQGALLSSLGALVACLLVWLYLRSAFTRPLQRIVAKLAAYTPDKAEWRVSEEGAHELAQIGRVVNRMFADLSAERATLRANADKFAQVFARAPVLFSLSDVATGRFTEVNDEAIRVSGFSRDEVIGKTSVELGWIAAADRERLLAVLRERGRVDGLELRLRTKSGGEVECLYYGDVITIDGKPQLVSVSQDISEMRRAERALRESEARLRALFDGAADAVFIHTPDGRFVDVNRAACASVGYTREELLTMSVRDIEVGLGPADLDRLWAAILAGRSTTLDGMQRRRDGSTFPVEVHVARFGSGERPLLFAAARDVTERKQAEQALRASALRYQRLYESMTDAAATVDMSGHVVEANPTFRAMLGYDAEELARLTYDELTPERWHAMEHVIVTSQVLAKGHSRIYEKEYRRRDGTVFPVELRTYLLRDEAGNPEGMWAIVRDITERRRMEEALRERNEYIETVLQNAPIGFSVHATDDGVTRFVSRRFEEIYGVPRGSFTSVERWYELAFPDPVLREQMRQRMRADIATGDVARMRWEDIPIAAGPEARYVTIVNIPVPDQRLMVTAVQDVTSRVAMEASLRQSERRLSLAISATADAVWEWHLDTGQTYYSPRWFEMLGHADGALDMTFDTWKSLCHPDDLRPTLARIRATLEDPSRNGYVAEFRLRHKDGSWVWIMGRGNVVERGKDGQPLLMSGTNTEISAQKRLEQQLLQAQKMEAIGQLAGGVAHDFNNTLTTTLMTLELLLDNGNLDRDTYDGLKALEAQAKRASSLTRQLLLFSRRSVPEMRVLDLNEVVANLLKMLGRLLGEHIGLAFERCPIAPRIEADAGMIEQVLMNLCVNARDAMPRGGRITIAIQVVEASASEVSAHVERADGRYVCASVSDTGAGMSEDTMGKIFEPFFTTKEPGKGTGLGLATVHGIVAQHGGWVEVRSTLGQGSVFRVLLPEATRAMVVPDTAGPAAKAAGLETILLVEDEPGIREVTALSLRRLGYTILEASNGTEALEIWAQHPSPIALLLSDMMMPGGLTGHDLALRLREAKPNLKVVICSGYIPEASAHNSQLLADIIHVQKPYHVRELSKIIRQCLDQA
jgi:two-component system cell cycle sensor histidine kinase/response regulator CckA